MSSIEFLEAEDISGHYDYLAKYGIRPPLPRGEWVYVVRVLVDGTKWAQIKRFPFPLDTPERMESVKQEALKVAKVQFDLASDL